MYFDRGFAHDENGDYDAAITDYTEVIWLNPEYAEAYHNRGYAHAQLGNHGQATADRQKARERGFESRRRLSRKSLRRAAGLALPSKYGLGNRKWLVLVRHVVVLEPLLCRFGRGIPDRFCLDPLLRSHDPFRHQGRLD